jgi:hypothetical protein
MAASAPGENSNGAHADSSSSSFSGGTGSSGRSSNGAASAHPYASSSSSILSMQSMDEVAQSDLEVSETLSQLLMVMESLDDSIGPMLEQVRCLLAALQ